MTSTRVARLRATGTVRVGGRRLPLRPAAGRVKVAGGGIELRLRLPAAALQARRAVAHITVIGRAALGRRAARRSGRARGAAVPR